MAPLTASNPGDRPTPGILVFFSLENKNISNRKQLTPDSYRSILDQRQPIHTHAVLHGYPIAHNPNLLPATVALVADRVVPDGSICPAHGL